MNFDQIQKDTDFTQKCFMICCFLVAGNVLKRIAKDKKIRLTKNP